MITKILSGCETSTIERDETFSGSPVVKSSPANARDTGSVPVPGRSHRLRGSEAHVPRTTDTCALRAHAPPEKVL